MKERWQKLMAQPALQQFVAELESNERLRWLLFGVALVVVVYFALVVDDWRIAVAEDYEDLAQREARLEYLETGSDTDFQGFYEEQKAANDKLRERFWQAKSAGLAGAELQSWLRVLAADHNLRKMRLDVSDIRPVPNIEDPLWQLEAELTGEILPNHVMSLIAALARSERAVVVQRLAYSPPGGDRLSLRLAVNFRIGEPTEEGSG